MSRVRVLLADDHTLVRAGLRKLLEATPGFEVVGEAGDGLALLDLVEKLQPQVVLSHRPCVQELAWHSRVDFVHAPERRICAPGATPRCGRLFAQGCRTDGA